MKSLSKTIFTSIFFVWIFYSTKIYAQKSTIQILTEKPDIINIQNWENYSSLLKDYIVNKNKDNPKFNNIDINFSFNSDESSNKKNNTDIENYIKFVTTQLQDSRYDLLVLDERFLFSDYSFIESKYVNDLLEKRKIHQFYMDLTSSINNNLLIHHNKEILKGGYFENKLFGLPYETDFDLLYFQKNDDNHTAVNNLEKKKANWDNLLSILPQSPQKNLINMALGDDDELLNLVVEYFKCYYNPIKNDESNFELFYNEKSKELFRSFREFINKSSSLNLNKTLEVSKEDAYKSFLNNESVFFKGKASHYRLLTEKNSEDDENSNNNSTEVKRSIINSVTATLPPYNTTILDKKYLVINKNSKIDKNILIDLAIQLTSSDIQLYKAEKLGILPTIDISQFNSTENISQFNNTDYTSSQNNTDSVSHYCQINPEICYFVEKMKPIHVKDIFKSEFSPPFMEVRLLLPKMIRQYLSTEDYNTIKNVFENIRSLVMEKTDNLQITTKILYIPMIIFTLIAVVVMGLVLKYRNHPHMKLFSPVISNLIIIGITMNILSAPFMIQNHNILKCQIRHVYETVDTNLCLLPMIVIAYRVYFIYKNKSNIMGYKRLKNSRLILFILSFVLLMAILSSWITYKYLKFYLVSYGNIDTYRHPTCSYDEGRVFDISERALYTTMFFILVFIVLKTGKISKKFDEFRYPYIMIISLIVEYARDYTIYHLPSKGYFGYYVIIFIVYMLGYFFCIYLLIGRKLIYAVRHPLESLSYNKDAFYRNYIDTTYSSSNNSFIKPSKGDISSSIQKENSSSLNKSVSRSLSRSTNPRDLDSILGVKNLSNNFGYTSDVYLNRILDENSHDLSFKNHLYQNSITLTDDDFSVINENNIFYHLNKKSRNNSFSNTSNVSNISISNILINHTGSINSSIISNNNNNKKIQNR